MRNQPSVEDCLRFIRAFGVLDKWSDAQIIDQIIDCLNNNCLAFATDHENKLISICLGRWHETCCMHIIAIAGYRGALYNLYRHLRKRFPHVTKLRAERNGKPVEYDVNKFFRGR